jgi:hypothetical protein
MRWPDMHLAAKILFTLTAALILLVIMVSARATPMSDSSLLTRGTLAVFVTAVVLPFAAMAILPWLARDDAAPAGTQFRGSITLLIFSTGFRLLLASAAIALTLPVTMLLLAALKDTTNNRDWIMFAVAVLSLPGMVLLLPTMFYILHLQVILPWRWRRWPLITIADDGLYVPGKPPLPWSSLAGTQVEIAGSRYPALRITGPETKPHWPFGPQPVLRLGVMLMNYFGDKQVIADAISNHPNFPSRRRPAQAATRVQG